MQDNRQSPGADESWSQGRIDVSVVAAVYNVARYLPDFLGSLEAQRGVDLSRIEVVAVDDGSTDDSLEVLRAWAAKGTLTITVLTKPNGGQGSARNLGLGSARGTWVTFTDPDDVLPPDYLAEVLGFAAKHPKVELLATNRVFYNDLTGELIDTHPLRDMFDRNRLVDLSRSPGYFAGSAPACFFRRERLVATGQRFDERIRPNFEDGHFCGVYLLACDRPLVGFVASAIYHYRKRFDGTSTLQGSVAKPERYTVVPRLGYLDLLDRGAARHGVIPGWVQNLVLYDLSWYFSAEVAQGGTQTAARGEVAAVFRESLKEIARRLDPELVESFRIRRLDPVWREILLHGFDDEPWHAPYAAVGMIDRDQHLVRVMVRFIGPEPRIEFVSKGRRVEPEHTKVRTHVYFDQVMVRDRIAWVPSNGSLRVLVDGRAVALRRRWPSPSIVELADVERRSSWRPERRPPVSQPRTFTDLTEAVGRRIVRVLASTPPVRRRYAGAWVLVDRLHDADDSAEHLFHHLRAQRPDINAWFTVERGTPDWHRLRRRDRSRVVAAGSLRWKLLMLNCAHLISSHVDVPVHRPPAIMRMLPKGRVPWRFTFLQHGVIKDDLSTWLNGKLIDLFVTSTPGEQESIAGDQTSYLFTTKEARLTGLPRFDRLYELDRRTPPENRNLILIAPTWRHWLVPPLAVGSQRREVRSDFLETEFAREWLAVLRSERLRDLAEEHGLTVAFLPHPNLQAALDQVPLPAHVKPMSFEGANIQQMFVDAAVLVTDYSSMAFNAAYIDRPVVYFQFDAQTMQDGGHVGRAGYFQYERDGFGPVAVTPDGVVDAIDGIAGRGCRPDAEYQQRIDAAFPQRDGKCCERVTQEIEALAGRADLA